MGGDANDCHRQLGRGAAGEAWGWHKARGRPSGCVAAPSVTTAGATLVGGATRGSRSCRRRVFFGRPFRRNSPPSVARQPPPAPPTERLFAPLTRGRRALSRGGGGISSRYFLSDGGLHRMPGGVDRNSRRPRPPRPPPTTLTWGWFARSVPIPSLSESLNPLPPTPLRSAPREHPLTCPCGGRERPRRLCLVGFRVRRWRDRGGGQRGRRACTEEEEGSQTQPKRLLLSAPATDKAAPGGWSGPRSRKPSLIGPVAPPRPRPMASAPSVVVRRRPCGPPLIQAPWSAIAAALRRGAERLPPPPHHPPPPRPPTPPPQRRRDGR